MHTFINSFLSSLSRPHFDQHSFPILSISILFLHQPHLNSCFQTWAYDWKVSGWNGEIDTSLESNAHVFENARQHKCGEDLFFVFIFGEFFGWGRILLLENLLKWVVPTGAPLLDPPFSTLDSSASVARHGGFVLPRGDLHSQPPIKTILPFYGDNTLCPQEEGKKRGGPRCYRTINKQTERASVPGCAQINSPQQKR